ncbi:MAG: hypothetical protein M3041_00660 [Acidobacteriota bacterium]|nr:hypothetical protein [Acidobacteriota bacterium]
MLAAHLALSILFAAGTPASRPIPNIGVFLDQCPDRDTAYLQIRSDFEIRRGRLPIGPLVCTEPVSTMPVSQYTDELITVQALRVMYYMDRGQSGHLPWTAGTLYDWMKSKIGGIDVEPNSSSFCCSAYGGKTFITVGTRDDFTREIDKSFRGIADSIALLAHEARHVDGFPHSSCCGIPFGCDNTFDPANLAPYGIQWWLTKMWLDGTVNVGFACVTPANDLVSGRWFALGLNEQYRTRFCRDNPPLVSNPPVPFGACFERHRTVRK